jgi:nitrate reductase gamma subunit
MSFLTIFFALLFYVATFSLVAGLAYRIRLYIKTPAPLKIPTTPAPVTRTGVALRLFREVVFFESLFKATLWTWLFGWMFHFGMFLVLLRHLRYFINPEWFWAPLVWPLVGLVQPFGLYAGFAMLAGLGGLLVRRFAVDRVRYISAPSDFIWLFWLMGIAASGLIMSFILHTDIVQLKEFTLGLMSLSPGELPVDLPLLIHLGLVAVLMALFPYSKLLHAVGIFFSPTRNQVDNPREKRHLAAWAAKYDDTRGSRDSAEGQ